jgi:hypothetical protein
MTNVDCECFLEYIEFVLTGAQHGTICGCVMAATRPHADCDAASHAFIFVDGYAEIVAIFKDCADLCQCFIGDVR